MEFTRYEIHGMENVLFSMNAERRELQSRKGCDTFQLIILFFMNLKICLIVLKSIFDCVILRKETELDKQGSDFFGCTMKFFALPGLT